jgi:hypothetical protein
LKVLKSKRKKNRIFAQFCSVNFLCFVCFLYEFVKIYAKYPPFGFSKFDNPGERPRGAFGEPEFFKATTQAEVISQEQHQESG